MRIGTWNLEGHWDKRHEALIEAMRCDLLLLTEVSERVVIPGHQMHATAMRIAPRRYWSAIAAQSDLQPLPDPHGATALCLWRGLRVASSILPWRGCGDRAPWLGINTAEQTINAVAAVEALRPTVWGGDWNHALSGTETSGSFKGREAILEAVDRLQLTAPTARLPHCIDGVLSIDHVAVPMDWTVVDAERLVAEADGVRISDHDAYVVQVE